MFFSEARSCRCSDHCFFPEARSWRRSNHQQKKTRGAPRGRAEGTPVVDAPPLASRHSAQSARPLPLARSLAGSSEGRKLQELRLFAEVFAHHRRSVGRFRTAYGGLWGGYPPGRGVPVGRSGGCCGSTSLVGAALGWARRRATRPRFNYEFDLKSHKCIKKWHRSVWPRGGWSC